MKTTSVFFLVLLISFFCVSPKSMFKKERQSLNLNAIRTYQDSTTTNISDSTTSNPTDTSSNTAGTKTSGTTSSDSPFSDPSFNITEFCQTVKEAIAALGDMDLEVQKLIKEFKEHVKLYEKWESEATNKADKEALKAKEKVYLDKRIKEALEISTILPGIETQVYDYETYKCNSTEGTSTSSNAPTTSSSIISTSESTTPTSESGASTTGQIDFNTSILIQMIVERYQKLGLKMDPKIVTMVELKNRKTLKMGLNKMKKH